MTLQTPLRKCVPNLAFSVMLLTLLISSGCKKATVDADKFIGEWQGGVSCFWYGYLKIINGGNGSTVKIENISVGTTRYPVFVNVYLDVSGNKMYGEGYQLDKQGNQYHMIVTGEIVNDSLRMSSLLTGKSAVGCNFIAKKFR